MVAAKSSELDSKIPFLSTIKKHANLHSYSRDDIKKAEI
jgi:hypothetical protein